MLVMENWIQWKKKEIANSKEKVASDTGWDKFMETCLIVLLFSAGWVTTEVENVFSHAAGRLGHRWGSGRQSHFFICLVLAWPIYCKYEILLFITVRLGSATSLSSVRVLWEGRLGTSRLGLTWNTLIIILGNFAC
jgi:hypothetical protein